MQILVVDRTDNGGAVVALFNIDDNKTRVPFCGSCFVGAAFELAGQFGAYILRIANLPHACVGIGIAYDEGGRILRIAAECSGVGYRQGLLVAEIQVVEFACSGCLYL